MIKWISGLAVAMVVGASTVAWANVPGPWAGQLSRQLAVIEQQARAAGFALTAGPYSGGARSGEAVLFTVQLESGSDYRIVGVCDNDCADLDLRLFDQNGQLIEEDLARNDHPVVTSQPAWTGQFIVEARIYDCRHPGGCYFAFNVFGRGRADGETPGRTMPRA